MTPILKMTYTGPWLEFDGFDFEDFDVEYDTPIVSEYSRNVHGQIVLRLKSEVTEALIEAWVMDEYNHPLDKAMEGCGLISIRTGLEFMPVVIPFCEEVRLQGVRKEATRKAKYDEAVKRIEKREKSEGLGLIAEKIQGINETITHHINDYVNADTMRRAEETLRWFEPWVEEADKKGDTLTLKAEIKALKAKVEAKETELRQRRNVATYAIFEEIAWVGPKPGNDTLPEKIVERWKDMLKTDKGFVRGGFFGSSSGR